MSKCNNLKIVDGSQCNPPYFAVLNRGWARGFINDRKIWKRLESRKIASAYEVLGYGARVWVLPSSQSAQEVVALLGEGYDVVTHGALDEFPPRTSTHYTIGDAAMVKIPGRASKELRRMIEFLELKASYGADGCIIHWATLSANPIPPAVLSSLTHEQPPPFSVKLRRSNWLITIELSTESDFDKIIAREVAQYLFPRSTITIAELPEALASARRLGLSVDADFDPDAPLSLAAIQDFDVAGWHAPTSSGRSLRDYQKDGVKFAAALGGRSMNCDDRGLGKTAQAISFASAIRAQKLVVIAPALLKNNWLREIQAWEAAKPSEIQVWDSRASAGVIPADARVVITSYDLIVTPAQTWKEPDKEALHELSQWLSRRDAADDPAPQVDLKKGQITFHFALSDFANAPVPAVRLPAWEEFNRKLANPLLESLIDWSPDVSVFDEVHRAKTPTSKRSIACLRLSEASRNVVGLSGTPIQNRPEEGAALARLINPRAYQGLVDFRVSIERCKEMLGPITIRRLKSTVLSELPSLTEELIELTGIVQIPNLEENPSWNVPDEQVPIWAAGLAPELADFARWIPPNITQVSSMRKELGKAKASSSEALDEIIGLLDSGPLVVFCAHHDVIDLVAEGLQSKGIARVVPADGRLSAARRAEIVDQFQNGDFDCLVAGMESMGEGVTLTRASRVVFLETTWKASTFEQARDRLHRIGQTSKVHALYLLAPHALDHCLHAMVTYKAAIASAVHEEDVHVFGAVISGTVEGGKLQVVSARTPLPAGASEAASVSDALPSSLTSQPAANEEIIAIRLRGFPDAIGVSDDFDYTTLLLAPSKGALRMRAWRARQGKDATKKHTLYMREWRKSKGE